MRILLTLMLSLIALTMQAQQDQTFSLTGTCTITQVGSCTMSSEPYKVKLDFTIDAGTGKVTGHEFRVKDNGVFEKDEDVEWSGEVLNPQAIRFQQKQVIICGSETRTEILHFIGVLSSSGDNVYKMKLRDTYAMCPASNCIFDIEYDLELKL